MALFTSDCIGYISGAGSGIGRATTVQLLADGLLKLALADLSTTGLQETKALIEERNPAADVLLLFVDVSNEEEFQKAFEQAVDHFGRIDYCANCVGIVGKMATIDKLETKDLEKVFNVNTKAMWWSERAQIQQFLKQELRPVSTGLPLKTRGSIVNISSIVGLVGAPSNNPYVMSKHAIIGLTKSDAVDYAEKGIRVNAVCPGFVKTAILPAEVLASARGHSKEPMNRIASPEEIAYVISFVLSDRSSYITGASISIDGGFAAI